MGAVVPFVHLGRVGTALGIDLVRFLGTCGAQQIELGHAASFSKPYS